MRHLSNFERQARRAFSLIEMLVVVSIIVMLMALATPALMRTMQASRLAATGDALFGAISEAQQTAYAQNVPVELRFFKYADPEFQGSTALFQSYQLFKIVLTTQGGGLVTETVVPLGNLIKLSEGIAIATDTTLSPLLSGTGISDAKQGSPTGYSGVAGATYNAIRFMTDGSCKTVNTQQGNFATTSYSTLPVSFLTLSYSSGQNLTAANLPPNFYTIQIDPYTGKARSYKPGF